VVACPREIEAGRLALEPPAEIADRWVRQGVLLTIPH